MGIRFKVKELTTAKGWSRYRLSRLSGVDDRILRKIWESDQSESEIIVNTHTLARIADTLEVDISELLESDPPRPRSDPPSA